MTTPVDPRLDPFFQIGVQRVPPKPMPWPARPEYRRGPFPPEPLKPRYTEKLPKSPAFKTLPELAQRRRDFWGKVIARSGVAMMVGALAVPFYPGNGLLLSGAAFVAGLIIFAVTCFVSGARNRNRLL